jgi:hypothetical protein
MNSTLIAIFAFCSVAFPFSAPKSVQQSALAYSDKCVQDLTACAKTKAVEDCIKKYPKWGLDPEQGRRKLEPGSSVQTKEN